MNKFFCNISNNKYFVIIFVIVVTGMIFLNSELFYSQTKYKYVGVNTCAGVCHKSEEQGNQFEVWNNSRHSKAFLTLQTEMADSIAKSKGFVTAAAETPECVKCHTLGKDFDESEFKGTFDLTQGVQCESCHGPGSGYSKRSVMKNRETAFKKGLIIHDEKEKFCIQCHNTDSPTYFEFNYEPMWEMIAHNKIKQ